MNTFIYNSYSRVATIHANSRSLRLLFESGYYSKCGINSKIYGTAQSICSPFIWYSGVPGSV